MKRESSNESASLSRIYAWFSAVITEDIELLEDLLAHGVPIDIPHPLRHSTALMEATRLGRIATVLWLLERGATPAFLCGLPHGTPLHCAIRRQHWAIASLLTDAMPSTAVMDSYGRSPLHLMAMEGLEGKSLGDAMALAPMLIAKGTPLDALDQDGTAALHHCVINDLPELAEILLKAGANPNATIPDTGVSPLAIAALEHNLTLASMLLKYKADPNQPTKEGLTPISILPSLEHIAETMLDVMEASPHHHSTHPRTIN